MNRQWPISSSVMGLYSRTLALLDAAHAVETSSPFKLMDAMNACDALDRAAPERSASVVKRADVAGAVTESEVCAELARLEEALSEVTRQMIALAQQRVEEAEDELDRQRREELFGDPEAAEE